jgi:hypothetical protein
MLHSPKPKLGSHAKRWTPTIPVLTLSKELPSAPVHTQPSSHWKYMIKRLKTQRPVTLAALLSLKFLHVQHWSSHVLNPSNSAVVGRFSTSSLTLRSTFTNSTLRSVRHCVCSANKKCINTTIFKGSAVLFQGSRPSVERQMCAPWELSQEYSQGHSVPLDTP